MRDVIIVGGGMVGAAVAVGLAQLGLTITLIETHMPKAYEASQPMDLRVSAISLGSEKLLQRLGVLTSLLSMRNAAYQGLEAWELDGFITQFYADEINHSHLGHIVENRLIQLSLWQQIKSLNNIEVICPATVTSFAKKQDSVSVLLDNQDEITARLLVGADGANSKVRQWAGIGIQGWDYHQSAMLINIETKQAQQDITWQQFTPQGPRALLPLAGNHASLVWYDSPTQISQLLRLDNDKLAQAIKHNFPARLSPDFTVLDKGAFPLTRRHAKCYYRDNVVIVGDAAHTINPLAGQGVNLGFKDVTALIDVITKAISKDQTWWHTNTLKQYQSARYKDNALMISAMDVFYNGFSNDILPLKMMRNIGFKIANKSGLIKKQVLKYAVGL